DWRAGEPVHLRHSQPGRGTGCVFHTLGCSAPNALGIAVAPDVRGKNGAVTLVDPVAHRLADQMRPEREAPQAVSLEDLDATLDVVRLRERPVDLEVVAPARE